MSHYKAPGVMLLALTLSLGWVGCSSDDESGGGDGTIGTTEESTVKGFLSGVVLPLGRQVYMENFVETLGAASGPGMAACQALSGCSSGSAEICDTPNGAQVMFTNCSAGGVAVNGTLDLSGTSGQGTAGLNLTLNGITLAGSVSYTYDVGCFQEVFTSVSGTAQNLAFNVQGVLRWCSPPTVLNGVTIPTDGVLTFTIPEKDWSVEIQMFSDNAPGELAAGVYDIQHTQHYLACAGTIFNPSCFVP